MSPRKLATLIESLRDTVAGLSWEPEGTAWADYADNTSYGDAATKAKMQAVEDALVKAGGRSAWDLGANTGRYSRIAADAGYRVVALDIDPAAVERGYRALKRDGRTDITPLPMIASLFARMAPHAVVEFVPKEDPMVQRLLAFRRDVFAAYHIDGFRSAFNGYFEVEAETPIEGSDRILFHLRWR